MHACLPIESQVNIVKYVEKIQLKINLKKPKT